MKQPFVPLAAIIAASLVGCNHVAAAKPAVPQLVAGQESAEELTVEQRDVAELAIAALATDLGIAKDKIAVDTIRSMDWRDSSIGCPQPGQAYLQVITPGHKITLRVDRQIYVVHEAGHRAFVCHNTREIGAAVPQFKLVFGEQLSIARKDLAARLGVPESEIRPASAEERTWDDAGLGCPEPGVVYPPGPVAGWVLKLKHQGRDFIYHTDLKRTIPCPAIASE